MKTIIIFYEHKARELDMCNLVKEKIERTGNSDVYIFSYHWQKIDALNLLKKKKIDFIIIPFAYTNSDVEFYKIFYVKNPNVVIACIHHEELTCAIWDDLILPREKMAKNALIHYVWTDTFKELLHSAGVKKELIYVTGNVRNDLTRSSSMTKARMAKEMNLDPNKKWLLFAEDRMIEAEERLLNLDNPMEKRYLDEDIKSLNETMNQMEMLDENFFLGILS